MRIFVFIILSFLTCNALAAENSNIDTIPKPLLRKLQNTNTIEQFVFEVLRGIRSAGTDKSTLSAQDIENKKAANIASLRANKLSAIIVMDTNNDGKATKDEISAYYVKQVKTKTDNDTFQRDVDMRVGQFIKFDLNGDGIIDYEEMRTLSPQEIKSSDNFKQMEELLALDPNKDGILTVDELKLMATDAFNIVDINKDGMLSIDEKMKLRAKIEGMQVIGTLSSSVNDTCLLQYPDTYDTKYNYTVYYDAKQGSPLEPKRERQVNVSSYLNKNVPDKQLYELHVIGSYEGMRKIKVLPSKKPLIIVLASSAEANEWDFDLQAGANIKQVILQGTNAPKIKNLPSNIPLDIRSECAPYAYQWEAKNKNEGNINDEYRQFIKRIQQYTGLIETSFQGGYRLERVIEVPFKPDASLAKEEIVFVDPSTKDNNEESLQKYKAWVKTLPVELKPTFDILITMMANGKLPVQFPNDSPGLELKAPRFFEELNYSEAKTALVDGNSNDFKCDGNGKNSPSSKDIIIGNGAVKTFYCPWGDQIYWSGDNDNNINDAWGNDIINAGKGDDVIQAHWGRDIIVFEKNWGKDVVDKTCHAASIKNVREMYGYERNKNWNFPFENFIVFGPGVYEKDMKWESDKVLKNTQTGDQITFNSACFNIVYFEDNK